MQHRPLLFKFYKDEQGLSFKQTKANSIMLILLVVGFLLVSFFYQNWYLLLGLLIIVGLDLGLDSIIIIFLRKDAVREGKQFLESGSILSGNKEYRVLNKSQISDQQK